MAVACCGFSLIEIIQLFELWKTVAMVCVGLARAWDTMLNSLTAV